MWGSDVRTVGFVFFELEISIVLMKVYEVVSGTFAANLMHLCFIQAR